MPRDTAPYDFLSRIVKLTLDVQTQGPMRQESRTNTDSRYIRGFLIIHDLMPRMTCLKALVVLNLPRLDAAGGLRAGLRHDVHAKFLPSTSISTLVLGGCSPRLDTLWCILRHLNSLSNLDISWLEPPAGVEALDDASMLVSETHLEDKVGVTFQLHTFACNLFHLDPKAYSTVTLINALTKSGCFNRLQSARLHLDPGSSEGWITDKVKDALGSMLRAAGPALERLQFDGFPLSECILFFILAGAVN